jgi:hypothetical protein
MATQGMTNFPRRFRERLSVRGMPLVQTQTGKVFWVLKSGAANQVGQKDGSDGNRGTYDAPFATIAGALGMCTAGRGDTIFVKAGHTEAIADATTLALNVKGVAIIGLGTGSSRPTLTFGTATTANIPVTAADMAIQNILFKSATSPRSSRSSPRRARTRRRTSRSSAASSATSSSQELHLDRHRQRDGQQPRRLRFVGNRISSLGISTATTAIKIASDTDRVTIQDNFGNWAVLNNTAAMLAAGSAQITNFDFGRNVCSVRTPARPAARSSAAR